MDKIANLTVNDYLNKLAAPVFPGPAVGSAAATTAAMAAALVEMSYAITLKKDMKQLENLEAFIKELTDIRRLCLAIATEDVLAYGEVVKAAKLKKESPTEFERAMKRATDTLVAIVKNCESILTNIEQVVQTCYEKVLGDLAGSAFLAEAAANTARAGVEVNLQQISDQNYKKGVTASVQKSYKKCLAIKEKIIAKMP